MDDEFKHIEPPKYKVRVFISADGGNWWQGHDEDFLIQESTLDQAVEWMKENIPGYGEGEAQRLRE
jgi:hypothetical protein